MTLDMSRLHGIIDDFYGSMPHPRAPRIMVKDYPAFERVAQLKKAKRSGEEVKVTGQEVNDIHDTLKNLEMSPHEFESAWRVARPMATRLLGRDPEMDELKSLANQHPEDVMHYYRSMPHPQYPEVSAGEVARYHNIAEPIARAKAQRQPAANELAQFALAGYTADDVKRYYEDDL